MRPEKEQIDEMINEGLGAGRIDDEKDKKQLKNPLSEKPKKQDDNLEKENSMATNFSDVKKLGKEMENMKTNKNIKKGGQTPDPIQD